MEQFSRTAMLLGRQGIERLAAARVIVFGIGGVGGFAAESLVRSGVGAIDLVDSDRVSVTNLNRQLIALHSTVGRQKVDVLAERLLDINPSLRVTRWPLFYLPETAGTLPLSGYDYIVDAVDTVAAKLTIICGAAAAGVPVISAMGAGNKLDPTRLRVADIFETSVDPLCRVMRRELRQRGIQRLKVVYSTEPPLSPQRGELIQEDQRNGLRRDTPGSAAFVPAAMGLTIGAEVVRALAGVQLADAQ